MEQIGVANAPCSWGCLEFDGMGSPTIGYQQMLDELVETGYSATELGDWGYFPTDPLTLRTELATRDVEMLGAFVPIAFADPSALNRGTKNALRAARLLAAVATETSPHLVLADDNGSHPMRTACAGRIRPQQGLSSEQWRIYAANVEHVARTVAHETGIESLFHHHCAGWVETPNEIARLLDLIPPESLQLVFDTGHYAFASQDYDLAEGLRTFGDRIRYVHLKDCDPTVADRSRQDAQGYFWALERGLFNELGSGGVNLSGMVSWLRSGGYVGYVTVEQDLLPGLGTPRESALHNRKHLRSLGL